MKFLKNILTVAALVLMAAGFSSCYFRFSDKTKKLLKNELRYTLSDLDVKIDTVTYNVGQFNAVDIDMIMDDIVIVQTEGESKVDLMACDFLIDSILVTNEEGTLKLRLNDGTSRPQGRIKVQIYAPAFCSISNNGCGDISISAYKGDSLSIKTSGSGDVIATNLEIAGKLSVHSVGSGDHEFEHITAANMDIARSGSGDGEYSDLNIGTLSVTSTGSGDATLSGKADSVTFHKSGSGDIDASELKAKSVKTQESGSGDLIVNDESINK